MSTSGWLSEPLGDLFGVGQQRRIIDLTAGIALAATIVAAPYSLFALGATEWLRWTAFAVGLAGFIAAPIVMRIRDSLASGALILLMTGVVLIVTPASYGGGAGVVFAVWFLLVPLLAGLLLGPRMAILFGALGVVLVTVFYEWHSEAAGPESHHGLGSFLVWLNLSLAIGFSAAVGAISSRAILASSARLKQARLAEVFRTEQLEESLARHRASFEAAFDAMITLGEDGRVLEFNPAAEKIFGRTRSEIVHQEMAPLLIPQRMRKQHERSFRTFVETGAASIIGQRVELEALRADGSEFPVELIVQPIRLSGGLHFTAYVRDLTDYYLAQKELSEAERRLSQAQRLEAIGRLAGGVAHDFNNLLTAINGYAELLMDRPDLDEETTDSLEQIRRAGQQAGVVTEQLLAFSRTDRLAPSVTDVNEAVRNLFAMFGRLLPESIEIRTQLAPDLWPLDAGPERLEQVLLNLVLNAGDAMPQGGELSVVTRNVTFRDEDGLLPSGLVAGDYVEISVTDTGTGIDEETSRHVFEPFFTTKSTGDGTGLGLSTAYGSVRSCGGTIELSTDLGHGSSFNVILPRATDSRAAAEKAVTTVGGASGETVLVIEDQASLRRLLGRSLEKKGYRILLAEDGLDAIDRFGDGKERVDLVITDVVMPRLGGVATVERLRETLGSFVVIFMSGYLGETREVLPELGEDVLFLQKPFRLDELHASIRAAMGHEGEAAG